MFSLQIEEELDFNPRHAEPTHICEYKELLSEAMDKLYQAHSKIRKQDETIRNQRKLIQSLRARISDKPIAEGIST